MQPGLMLPQISCPVPFNFCPNPKTVSLRLTRPAIASTHTTVLPSARAGPLNRVDVLSESLSFIERFFYGKIVVVKYGGAAMKLPQLREIIIKDLDLLTCVGLRMVLVHDGGPEYNSCLTRDIEDEHKFIHGVRIRNKNAKEAVKMVLMTTVNKPLVTLITLVGATDIEISSVNPAILHQYLANNNISVIDPLATDQSGQAYNINADNTAGEIAAAVGAEKLILLTDVAGILEDRNDPNSLIRDIEISRIRKMIEEGKVAGGIIPKVECCIKSLTQGVHTASIIDSRIPHSLLLEILAGEAAGTTIRN